VSLDLNITVGDSVFHAQGEAQDVMKALGEFKALLEGAPKPRRQQAPPDEKQEGNGGGAPGTDQPLSVFVKRNWPGQAEKATAIVMWATHHDNKDALKPGEIEDYWRKTSGIKVPANSTAACQAAEKKGWLHNEGGGRYSVNGHGEEMVNSTPKG
jgi:hypothetical protein